MDRAVVAAKQHPLIRPGFWWWCWLRKWSGGSPGSCSAPININNYIREKQKKRGKGRDESWPSFSLNELRIKWGLKLRPYALHEPAKSIAFATPPKTKLTGGNC